MCQRATRFAHETLGPPDQRRDLWPPGLPETATKDTNPRERIMILKDVRPRTPPGGITREPDTVAGPGELLSPDRKRTIPKRMGNFVPVRTGGARDVKIVARGQPCA